METTAEVNGKSCLWQAGVLGLVLVDYADPSPQIFPFSFTSHCCLLPHPILNPHQDASRHVPRIGGFVKPKMMVIATDG